jgi:hypothetical protein
VEFSGFPEFWESTIIHERLAGEVGYPSRVSREGKAGPSEAGRGKYSPPANPERVTSGASERRDDSALLQGIEKDNVIREFREPMVKKLRELNRK